MKELLTRIIVAILGIPLLIFLIWKGDWYFFTLIIIISIGGQIEFYNFAKNKNAHAHYIPGILITSLLLVAVQNGISDFLLSIVSVLIIIVRILNRQIVRS